MYKKLIFLMSSFLTFSECLYAMEDNSVTKKIITENPEIENIKFDHSIYPKGRDPFEITEFKFGDIIDSRDPRLGLEIAGSYSNNRQNRVNNNENMTVNNPVLLKVTKIQAYQVMNNIYFEVLGHDFKKSCALLKVSYAISKNKSFLDNEFYIDFVESNEKGYGLAGLQTFLRLMEKNKELYQKINFFSLVDVNKDLDWKKIGNLYQKIGFASRNFENVANHKKIDRITNEINDTSKEIDKKNNEIRSLKKDVDNLNKNLNILAEEKMLMQNQYNINPETSEDSITLYRPRFLNNKEWQRDGSIDRLRDPHEIPYWKKHPIKK